MPLENPSTWTTVDKAVAVTALVLASGYAVGPVRELVIAGVSGLVGPLAVWLPFSGLVAVLGGVSGLAGTAARAYAQDRALVERARARTEELHAELAAATGDADDTDGDTDGTGTGGADDVADLQAELREQTLTVISESVKPAAYGAAVSIPAFLWLRWAVAAPAAAVVPAATTLPVVGTVAWSATLVGPVKLWLVWYLGASLSVGALSRRLAARVGLTG